MRNLRELEDLIIEAVYTDIIQGKLDQRNQVLEVDFCIGRDIQKKDISNIVKTLQEWWGSLSTFLVLVHSLSCLFLIPQSFKCWLNFAVFHYQESYTLSAHL